MAVSLSLIGGAGWQFFDDSGLPLSGGKIYTYAAGTTTPLTTYTSRDGLTANANPIILDAAGRTPQQIWSTEGLLYKYVIVKSNDVQIRVWDNIGGTVVASDLGAELANTTDNSKGDALIGFRQSNSSGFLTGATARTVNDKLQETVSVKDFGAVGDGIADDTAAVQAWFAAVIASGGEGYAPAGTYKVTSPIVFDYVNSALLGFTLRGDGVQKTIFTSTVTTSGAAAFSILTSGGSVGAPAIGVYAKITQIGFFANFAGTTLRVGYQDYSDQQNLVRLECWISNSSDAADANCLEMNACYGCNIEYNGGLGTTANTGDNLRLRQCSFAHFFVSLGGTATAGPPAGATGTGVGIKITDSFNYGNVFTAPDVEYFDKGLVINTSSAVRNTFIGGTWGDFKTAVVSAAAGSENRFINPNINAPLVPFAASGGAIGLVRDTNMLQTAAPVTGGTVDTTDTIRYLKITAAGTLATLTINLPVNPTDQQVITIQTYSALTALTLAAGGSATIFDTVTSLAAGSSVSFLFNAPGNIWLRVQ